MEKISFVSEERQIELEEIFKEEIEKLQEKIISREDFIERIKLKKLSFSDFCYLVNTYIAPIKVIEVQDDLLDRIELLNIDNSYFNTELITDSYNKVRNNTIPKIKDIKKLNKYENMTSKGKRLSKKRSSRWKI